MEAVEDVVVVDRSERGELGGAVPAIGADDDGAARGQAPEVGAKFVLHLVPEGGGGGDGLIEDFEGDERVVAETFGKHTPDVEGVAAARGIAEKRLLTQGPAEEVVAGAAMQVEDHAEAGGGGRCDTGLQQVERGLIGGQGGATKDVVVIHG